MASRLVTFFALGVALTTLMSVALPAIASDYRDLAESAQFCQNPPDQNVTSDITTPLESACSTLEDAPTACEKFLQTLSPYLDNTIPNTLTSIQTYADIFTKYAEATDPKSKAALQAEFDAVRKGVWSSLRDFIDFINETAHPNLIQVLDLNFDIASGINGVIMECQLGAKNVDLLTELQKNFEGSLQTCIDPSSCAHLKNQLANVTQQLRDYQPSYDYCQNAFDSLGKASFQATKLVLDFEAMANSLDFLYGDCNNLASDIAKVSSLGNTLSKIFWVTSVNVTRSVTQSLQAIFTDSAVLLN